MSVELNRYVGIGNEAVLRLCRKQCQGRGSLLDNLGDLAAVIERKENAVETNQEWTLLLDGWPTTIAKTIATTTRFMRFS